MSLTQSCRQKGAKQTSLKKAPIESSRTPLQDTQDELIWPCQATSLLHQPSNLFLRGSGSCGLSCLGQTAKMLQFSSITLPHSPLQCDFTAPSTKGSMFLHSLELVGSGYLTKKKKKPVPILFKQVPGLPSTCLVCSILPLGNLPNCHRNQPNVGQKMMGDTPPVQSPPFMCARPVKQSHPVSLPGMKASR